jgi:hypothetical protein
MVDYIYIVIYNVEIISTNMSTYIYINIYIYKYQHDVGAGSSSGGTLTPPVGMVAWLACGKLECPPMGGTVAGLAYGQPFECSPAGGTAAWLAYGRPREC